MDKFMDALKKGFSVVASETKKITKTVAGKTNNIMDITKLNIALSDTDKKITAIYETIGKTIYEKYSEDSGYHLILEFTVDGTAELAEVTKENIGKEISLFADGKKVFSTMVVAEIIDGKIAIIGKTSNYKQLMSLSEKITG